MQAGWSFGNVAGNEISDNRVKMSFDTDLYGDELLIAAFALLPPNSHFKVVDEDNIVFAFYQVRQMAKFRILFGHYPFDEDGLKPRSSAISEGLESLQQSRLLGKMNPDLVDYSIDPALKVRFEMHVKPKLADKEGLIAEFSAEIGKLLAIKTA